MNEIKIGRCTFFVPAFSNISKKRFCKIYKNAKIDLDNAWLRIRQKLNDSTRTFGKEHNKAETRATNESVVSR